jgi:elongator complex protein 3
MAKGKIFEFDPKLHKENLTIILKEIDESEILEYKHLRKILRKYRKDTGQFYSKDELVAGYQMLVNDGVIEESKELKMKIRMKPTRTNSGVTTVTVLTKPFPCPGKCIFCPNDVKMPKSYLADEPGAQRAERNNFDPYLQTYNRLLALKSIGHNTDKVELIVLGGTWSFYPEEYQIWFIKQCFKAMNDFGVRDGRLDVKSDNIFEEADNTPRRTETGRLRSYNEIVDHVQQDSGKEFFSKRELATWEELINEQLINETAKSRSVGLVIETRPDYIDEAEVIKIRKLGATKVQIGIQSLQDDVMLANMRGHGRQETENAIRLLRLAGFKIHAHWMPNLYGSTVEKDIKDYEELWKKEVSPDELKIYPTSIIENTELYELYKRGKYTPYSYDQLLEVLANSMPKTPRFCRLTRVIRDIPSSDIVAGNKKTNFRQIAENEIKNNGGRCQCIRCREIRDKDVKMEDLELEVLEYESSVGKEYFLSYKTKVNDHICGFLRLAIHDKNLSESNFMEELQNKSIIREVHVYGQVVGIGQKKEGRSQHLGLGTLLMKKAIEISKENGYNSISVISAIGTREYYRKKGFKDDGMYLSQEI